MSSTPRRRPVFTAGCELVTFAILLALAAAAPAATLNSVQTGSFSMSTTTQTVTLATPIDPTRSFLTFGVSENATDPAFGHVTGQITNATTLTFERTSNGGTVTVKWYVASFRTGVTVQRGQADISDSTKPGNDGTGLNWNVTLGTAVDLTKAFPLVSYRVDGTSFNCNDFVRAELTSTTNLRLSTDSSAAGCGTAAGSILEWQVVEYQDASVRHGNLSFPAGSGGGTRLTQTVDLSGQPIADLSKAWLVYSTTGTPYPAAFNRIGDFLFRGRISNATTLTFDRQSPGTIEPAVDLTWHLIEFTDATVVQHANAAFGTGTTQVDVPLATPAPSATSIALGGDFMRGGRSPYIADDTAGVSWFSFDLTSATNLRITRGTTAGGTATADVGWFVLTFPASATPVMRVRSGSYQGDAAFGRAIFVGFQPDVVFVKRDDGAGIERYAVVRTSSMGNTKDLDNLGLGLIVDLIRSLTTTGFTIGSDPRVNESGQTYYWVAFQAADWELKVGSYTGNGSGTRSIPSIGFLPDYLMVMPDLTNDPNGIPLFTSITQAAGVAFDFDATQRGPSSILALQPDGFQVGTGGVSQPDLNANGVVFHYLAWNAVPGRMNAGSYTGDNNTARDLDVAGFFPEWVIIKKWPLGGSTERPTVHKPASTGVNADHGLYFVDLVPPATDTIQTLRPLGFQVGSDERTNSSTACGGACTYHWVAFGPRTAMTNHRSIGTRNDFGTTQPLAVDGASSTVSVPQGSNQVTCNGATCAWLTANRGRGDVIEINGIPYTVAWVTSETQLTLTTGFNETTAAGANYMIRRQHATIANWYQCVSNQVACPYFDAPTASLVADDRREVGIAYDESTFAFAATLNMNAATTDPAHDIVLTADPGNRHNGTGNTGARVTPPGGAPAFLVRDNDVTIEWLDIAGGARAVDIQTPFAGVGRLVLRNNLIHDSTQDAVRFVGAQDALIANNFIYAAAADGIDLSGFSSKARIYNNTIYGVSLTGITGCTNPDAILRNNIVVANGGGDIGCTNRDPASSNNLTVNGSGPTNSPAGGGIGFVNVTTDPASCGGTCVAFVNLTGGAENLHLLATSYANAPVDAGANLSSVFGTDIDGGLRSGSWDIGADEFGVTTAVKLQSFSASPAERSVVLEWQTASELNNLGFHLYRALSADGPYERITASPIPGLGNSPVGARYTHLDRGLENGVTYYYELEDIETTGATKRHGPVSATPGTLSPGSNPGAGESAEEKSGGSASRITYGEPTSSTLRELKRGRGHVELELLTEGFYAEPREDGSVILTIPGFVESEGLSLPVKRAWLDAIAGRKVTVVSVQASGAETFTSLSPSGAELPELVASAEGTVRAARHRARKSVREEGLSPSAAARVLSVGFQGEEKKALVELAPLRWDESRGQLLLARRLVVRLSFAEREPTESSLDGGAKGRGYQRKRSQDQRQVVARLATTAKGLHAVRYEEVLRGGRGVGAQALRLSRQGGTVAFHLEPKATRFEPGSVLYFLSEGGDANPYGSEAVYELEVSAPGEAMAEVSAAPSGQSQPVYWHRAEWEEDRYYQAALVDAPDLWLWDLLFAPQTKSYPIDVSALAPSNEPSKLSVWLQGTSDFPAAPDHHLRVSVNGNLVGELSWDGKQARHLEVDLAPGVLREGDNVLELENVGDTEAAYSMVMLDRYAVTYPRLAQAFDGRLEGRWRQSGTAELSGFAAGAHLLDVSDAAPRWLAGAEVGADSVLRLRAEAGGRYLAVSPDAVHHPVITKPGQNRLKSKRNRADYLLIGPKAFLHAAAPLVQLRQSEGLKVTAVAIEDVYSEFGFGEPTPEAVKDFLSYAYHEWQQPSPRYVVLLGDATYDFKDRLQTGVPNQVPARMVKTSYLWTASDPSYAAVNGDDLLPDLAIGRLPAATVEELQVMVEKIVSYETGEARIDRGPVVLVADNPDRAGNFEADAAALAAGVLASRNPGTIFLSQLGAAATRMAIVQRFDEGASLMSYAGHGGIHLWADENFFNRDDVASLAPQAQQPLVLTMNCLNGYFHFPYFNSLAEELVEARERGAIAAFSPSGLSLNGPANLYHRELIEELVGGGHERLGDAVLAAQKAFAETGAFPELLAIYHLLGDPALTIR
jgi:hypothetical protein